jgi:hypothetical protein
MIRDRTEECRDRSYQAIDPARLAALVIHRISLEALGIPDEHLDGPAMCAAFQDPRKVGGYTGNENPYAALVRCPEGVIDQCTPLLEVGKHAAAWNERAIGVAVAGDFRKRQPHDRQWHNAVLLAAVLSQAFDLRIVGHDELAGGSRDPDKRCPGPLWPMDRFRVQVREVIKNNRGDLGTQSAAQSLLARAGAIYGG